MWRAGPRMATPTSLSSGRRTATRPRANRRVDTRTTQNEMKVDGKPRAPSGSRRTAGRVGIIDQTLLPHRFATCGSTLDDAARAIRPCGARRAADRRDRRLWRLPGAARGRVRRSSRARLRRRCSRPGRPRSTSAGRSTRWWPRCATARARERVAAAYGAPPRSATRTLPSTGDRPARAAADRGDRRAQSAGEPVNVLTHCNAGWLATVDCRHRDRADLPGARPGHAGPCLGRRDAAAQPGRRAHRLGARPARRAAHRDRRQHRRPPDAARRGRHGDRRHRPRHRAGDVCNKIGTYLKALAARDNGVPFYVALPSPTIDFSVADGLAEIPIEQRGAEEVATMTGRTADGRIETVRIVPDGSPVANYAFDVTPARLVTGLITERGDLRRQRARRLAAAFPERAAPPDRVRLRRSVCAVATPRQARGIAHRIDPIVPGPTAGNRRPRSRSRAAPRGCCMSLGFCCVSELPLASGRRADLVALRQRRRNLDRRDQVLDRRLPRRPEMDGLSPALRPAVLRHHGRSPLRDFPEGHRPDRRGRVRRLDRVRGAGTRHRGRATPRA